MSILPGCKDPSLSALKSKGYNVVQLPRADLRPTQLLVEKSKRLQRLGELLSVFDAAADGPPAPPVSADRPGPNIAGTQSADLEVGLGLSVLRGIISALGGSTLGMDAAFARAATVQFEFSSTLENNSELALIDRFLAASQVNPHARAVAEMLEQDQVYVVTSTLKAQRINVAAKDSNKQSLGLNLPAIQDAIGANVKIAAAVASGSTVSFEGAVPLVFGFQAVRLIFEQGRYRTMRLVDAGGVVAEAVRRNGAAEGEPPCYLDVETMLLDH